MNPTEILDKLLPADENDPAAVRRYRLRVALVACSAWLTLFVALIPLLVGVLITGLPLVGRVAYGSELEQRVVHHVAPINKKLEQVVTALNDRTEEARALKLQLLERDIFATVVERCTAINRGMGGARFWTERLQTLKNQYRELTGLVYDEPTARAYDDSI